MPLYPTTAFAEGCMYILLSNQTVVFSVPQSQPALGEPHQSVGGVVSAL